MGPEPAIQPGERRGGRPWGGIALVSVFLAAVLFVGLGSDVPLGSHEGLLAETARNMVLDRPVVLPDGSYPSPWLIPNFDGAMRLRKTPLPYWTAAACAKVGGEVNEWTARLPSALAGLGTALLVAAMLWRRSGPATALLSAAVLASMGAFLPIARRAIADMPMTFFTTACLAAAWTAVERRGPARFWWLALAGAAGGLAMMAKGPVPLAVLPGPLLVAAILLAVRLHSPGAGAAGDAEALRRERRWAVGGGVAGAALFLALTLPWYLYVLLHVPRALAVWRAESVDRSMGEFGHGEPLYFYFIRLPLLVLPWTYLFLYGVVLALRRMRLAARAFSTDKVSGLVLAASRTPGGPDERPWLLYLGAWLVGPLVAFSAASGKQDHYILPIFPAVAMYSGLAMGHLFGSRSPDRLRAGRWTLAAHALAFAAAGLGLVLYFRRDMPAYLAPFGVLALILAAGAALAGALAWRGRLRAGMAALLATAAAAFLWSGPNLVAPMDRSTYDAHFACKVRDLVGAGADIFSLQGANGTLVYYCEHPIRIVNSDSDIRARMAKGRPFYLILMDQDAKETPIPGDLREIYREPNGREPERTRALLAWPGPPPK